MIYFLYKTHLILIGIEMRYLILTTILLLINSCSVYQASQNKGIAESDIKACNNKLCVLSLEELTVLSTREKAEGTHSETYRARRRKHNVTYGRALAYGVADVVTLGLAEIITTPVEGYLSNEDYIVFQVDYDKNDSITNISIQGDN